MSTHSDTREVLYPHQRRESQFTLPPFESNQDVEHFIRQFNEIEEANECDERTAIIHLQTAWRGGATDCGKANQLDGILTSLRATDGLTASKTRLKMNSHQKRSKNDSSKLCQLGTGAIRRLLVTCPLNTKLTLQ